MPTANPLEILLAHDRWATQQLLDACKELTPEQFHQRFEMGLGSLHDTTIHMLSAMRGWGDMLAGREPRLGVDLTCKQNTPQELIVLLDEITGDMAASAANHSVEEIVTGSRGGRTYSFTRGGVLTHIATHGMHHRAQCLNMLRQLKVNPLPPSSVLEWMLMADVRPTT